MYASLRAVVFGFAIVNTATIVAAVQLASFTPRIEISNAQCRAAYTTNIDGCTANDFAQNAQCSEACVQGLRKIGDVVKRVCKDVDVGETSIIGVFQNDLGIRALCPLGAAPAAPSATSSARAPPAQSTGQPPASRATSTSAAPIPTLVTSSSTSTSTSTSQPAAPQSSSTSSQGLVTDPEPTSVVGDSPSIAPPPASSAATPGPTRAPNAQLSNADSGGGSPFDVQAVSAAHLQLQLTDLMMAALVGTALLFVAWA